MIYAILEIDPDADANNRRVKIGVTGQRGRTRLVSLQTGNSRKLEIIALRDGDASVEQAFHARFAHLSIRGEWFWYRADLVDEISTWPRQYRVTESSRRVYDVRRRKSSRRVWAKDRDARFRKWKQETLARQTARVSVA